ncbi:MAG: DUF362 domain-containing protein [Actinomycetota bacterium]|nr:DUF362 domain-containing protein [Actinomycetota bacterium]
MRTIGHKREGEENDQAGRSKGEIESGESSCPYGLWNRIRKVLLGNVYLLGIVSLVWLIIRSGRKPSRLSYPCQQAALANTTVLFGAGVMPVAARLTQLARRKAWGIESDRLSRLLRVAETLALVCLAGILTLSLIGGLGAGESVTPEMRAAASSLVLPEMRSSSSQASDIFVAEGVPADSERGVADLINVMDANGLDFFRSEGYTTAAGPGGIIAADDIVLIKVNGEWRYRGGTNTDVIKGLVNAIVHHPNGFYGEVVIVENGQWDTYMDNRPDNQNPSQCNAEDRGQSFNDVAMMFSGSHRVSVYDWTAIQTVSVGEFSQGDWRDGYVYVPEIQLGYPKFTTIYGTQVSLRNGWWNGSSYDNDKVKLINVPVLKDHGLAGVTCCIKHFMGVQDLYQGTQTPPHDAMRTQGILAKLMLTARYPDLNIVDAIWVCPAGGPNSPYESAVRLDRLMASRDPIALDYYCGKHVLLPVSGNSRHDPDNLNTQNDHNSFHHMLTTSRDILVAGGKQVTMEESEINVYKDWSPDVPPQTPYEYLMAEGCTDYGFETWLLVANPNDHEAKVTVTYYTESGPLSADPVTVPARSRLTMNASATIWSYSSGIRVGSDAPVFVERAMYWDDRLEGHSATATDAGWGQWYLAEGCTDYGFETWLTILNPGEWDTTVNLRFFTEKGEVDGAGVSVPALSRVNVRVNDRVSAANVSTLLTSQDPVVAEISLYGPDRRSGTCCMGVKSPATGWYLAEGATHSGFDTWLLLFNPQPDRARAVVYLDSIGERLDPAEIVLEPGSRTTLHLNQLVPGKDVSAFVDSDLPIVASRSMYWEVPGGRAGHLCSGQTSTSTRSFLPEGCTAFGFDTWLLLYNPGEKSTTAAVYAMVSGGEFKLGEVEVPAHTRATIKVDDYYDGSLSLRVEATEPLCCERAIYWEDRSGGTCSNGCGLKEGVSA